MLFMNMASPLTGAPGAVLLYGLIGLIAWPNGRPGGLLGVAGHAIAWAILWVLMAWLWLVAPSSSANAITDAINAAPSGMSWLSTRSELGRQRRQGQRADRSRSSWPALSLAIGIAVAVNWHAKDVPDAGDRASLVYWVVGQGFGGIFQGGATDPNAGPLFVLLACVLYTLLEPIETPHPAGGSRRRAGRRERSSGGRIDESRSQTQEADGDIVAPARARRGRAALLAGCASADKNAATTPAHGATSSEHDGWPA